MGCWYETCGFSNLPIMPGDRVLLFLLARGTECDDGRSGFSYPSGQWSPICLPLFGKYDDDRGTLKLPNKAPKHWEMTKAFLSELKLVWSEHGYDKEEQPLPIVHDYENFLGPIERGWTRGTSARFGDRDHLYRFPLGQMLVREDVWAALLAMKVDTHWGEASRKLNLEHARKYVLHVMEHPPRGLSDALSIEDHFNENHSSFFTSIFHPGESGPHFGLYRSQITRDLIDDKIDGSDACEILFQIGNVAHANHMLTFLRRAWRPQPGKGSQDIHWDLHSKFASEVQAIAKEEARRQE
jgi:hypothetical protein